MTGICNFTVSVHNKTLLYFQSGKGHFYFKDFKTSTYQNISICSTDHKSIKFSVFLFNDPKVRKHSSLQMSCKHSGSTYIQHCVIFHQAQYSFPFVMFWNICISNNGGSTEMKAEMIVLTATTWMTYTVMM